MTRGQGHDDSFRRRLAVGQAEALLASDVLSDRVRGLERLGSTNTPRALERLVRAVQPGSGAQTPEERLTAVRELAAHTNELDSRRALGRVLGGHVGSSEQRGPLDELAQSSAALALARAGTPDALAALGKALAGSGAAARAAEEALVAHPPRDLAPLLTASAVPSEELVSTLAALGDQRAFGAMRALVQSGTPEVRARAAIGLTELGDYETVVLARRWVHAGTAAVLRVAGARILALAHEPDTASAIRSLLDDDRIWQEALTIAVDAPSPELVGSLLRRVPEAGERTLGLVILALGRAGGPAAIAGLERGLDTPRTAVFSAEALARIRDDAARLALERALRRRETRRLATLALVMRRALGNSTSATLGPNVAALAHSKDDDDRAVGALGTGVLDPRRIAGLLGSTDSRVITSAAALLLIAPDDADKDAIAALERSSSPVQRGALALGLARRGVAAGVSTETLVSLVDDRTAAAPLAAYALAARDDGRARERIDSILASDDPRLRLHTALGLGQSANVDAAGRLAGAYRFEVDPRVRWAIAVALSAHPSPIARRTLDLISALDPDPRARAAARLSAGGERLDVSLRGSEVLLFYGTNAIYAADRPGALSVHAPSGIELPLAPGPKGLVLVPGVPEGSTVPVAPGDERGKDPERGASGDQKDDGGNGSQ